MEQNIIIQTIIKLLKEQNKSQKNLTDYLGITQNAFTDWKSGRIKSYNKHLPQIAEFFDVSVDYLLGNTDKIKKEPTNIASVSAASVHMIPVFESVSAGFGVMAQDNVIDYFPCFIKSDAEAQETICIKVKGDSMYPKIEEGDLIQVHKQDSVDSGSIAVVLIDGIDGYVKKVVYDTEWIELHSINPLYPPIRFEGRDVLRVRVIGLVRKIIKDI